ncbi:hypothetical protein D0Y50_15560 [Salinimonas sediminis]|uniref:Uncharacterized protein n=1 Tax=Salinimonas sediminis TaxID=2303538 RepID=A0A346NQ46_9ALTE|nr:hypothetical protein D0Y50_15560 [Salinimonas sediminis]
MPGFAQIAINSQFAAPSYGDITHRPGRSRDEFQTKMPGEPHFVPVAAPTAFAQFFTNATTFG